MKLYEKIRQVRKEKKLSLTALEQRLKEIFGNKALRYNTLYRIEKGMRDPRIGSLSQICIGLGISLKELKTGVDSEEQSAAAQTLTRRDKTAQYVYSEKAFAQIISTDNEPFLGERLILEPGGKTKLEEDPIELGKFRKWVYVLKGKIACVVGEEKYILKKDEVICFESTIPHMFENNTPGKSTCIIIQNPKHI